MRKGAALALALAEAVKVPAPMLAETKRTYDEAVARGWGKEDFSAVTHVVEHRIGRTLSAGGRPGWGGRWGGGSGGGRRMRVLIVEDEKALAEVFRDFVEELGHEGSVAPSAEVALEKLTGEQPDAILLDVRLPGISGLDFLDLPSVRDSGVPVVVVSGVATEEQARQCLRLGALEFIKKPVSLERLGAVLTYVEPFALARRRAQGWLGVERRPGPRVAVGLAGPGGTGGGAAGGPGVELGAPGRRLLVRARLRAGKAVTCTFTPADGGQPMKIVGLVVRARPGDFGLWFLAPLPDEALRLSSALLP